MKLRKEIREQLSEISLPDEMWKSVPYKDFEEVYFVSNKSRIYKVDTNVMDRKTRNVQKGFFPTSSIDGNGYQIFTFYHRGEKYQKQLHRVLAETWLDNPYDHKCVIHLNNDKLDNRLENLVFGTYKQNMRKSILDGATKPIFRKALTDQDVDNILTLWKTGLMNQTQIADVLGFSRITVNRKITGWEPNYKR